MLGRTIAAVGILAAGLLLAVSGSRGLAADPATLTVTGAIDEPNRGPYDPFADALFQVLGVEFERAYAFDRAALEALEQHQLTVDYPNWPGPVTVEGPKLTDVLDAAGATGTRLLVQAVDGYAPEFATAEIDGFVLALRADGNPLAIGGRGPTWVVFPQGSFAGQDPDSDSGLAWAVFHIRVMGGG